jgi:hypothetical protein
LLGATRRRKFRSQYITAPAGLQMTISNLENAAELPAVPGRDPARHGFAACRRSRAAFHGHLHKAVGDTREPRSHISGAPFEQTYRSMWSVSTVTTRLSTK